MFPVKVATNTTRHILSVCLSFGCLMLSASYLLHVIIIIILGSLHHPRKEGRGRCMQSANQRLLVPSWRMFIQEDAYVIRRRRRRGSTTRTHRRVLLLYMTNTYIEAETAERPKIHIYSHVTHKDCGGCGCIKCGYSYGVEKDSWKCWKCLLARK